MWRRRSETAERPSRLDLCGQPCHSERRGWLDLLCGSRQPVDDEVFSVDPPQSPEAKFIADAWEPRERKDDACALPERVDDDDADSFAELPAMVEAATRREISRRRDSLSPNAVTDRLSALRVSRTAVATPPRRRRTRGGADVPSPLTKPAVTPRRRRAAWRGQHGEADVASPLTDGSPPLEALPQRKVRPEPYYSQPVQ